MFRPITCQRPPVCNRRRGGKIGIGAEITAVHDTFGRLFNEGRRFACDGRQFDALFAEGNSLLIGQIPCDVIHSPGHTPARLTHVAGDASLGDAPSGHCQLANQPARAICRRLLKSAKPILKCRKKIPKNGL